MTTISSKMVIDIWSDVACPYCYLGKRMLGSALAEFPRRDEVEIVWRSYQLDPSLETDTAIDIYQLLARKGYERPSILRAHDELNEKGAGQGIVFNFDKIVVANTFNAHRMMHFARTIGKEDRAHEVLFRTHFTDGKNVDDHGTLIALGNEIGLAPVELAKVLATDAYANAVRSDMEEAQFLGIEAVPHFMFNREHEIVGAEGSALLLQTLEVAFEEWKGAGSRGNSS